MARRLTSYWEFLYLLTLMLLVANFANTKWCKKTEKWLETLAHGYSSESAQWELSNEYQHDRVSTVFKNLCILVLWTKVQSTRTYLKQIWMKAEKNAFQMNSCSANICLILIFGGFTLYFPAAKNGIMLRVSWEASPDGHLFVKYLCHIDSVCDIFGWSARCQTAWPSGEMYGEWMGADWNMNLQ